MNKDAGVIDGARKASNFFARAGVGLANRIGDGPQLMYTGIGGVAGGLESHDRGGDFVDGALLGGVLGGSIGLARFKDFKHFKEFRNVYRATVNAADAKKVNTVLRSADAASDKILETVDRVGSALSRRAGAPSQLALAGAGSLAGGVYADKEDRNVLLGAFLGAKLGGLAGFTRPGDPLKLIEAGRDTIRLGSGPILRSISRAIKHRMS